MMHSRLVLAAPDKFRGTATASQVAQAIARAADNVGMASCCLPLADGGEGTVDAFGGANRSSEVEGPVGTPVLAGWRYEDDLAAGNEPRAIIEMAAASGLLLAGGAGHNDPIAATTRGTGQLILAALDAGAKEIIVGVGGSATTDGGFGAVREILGRYTPEKLNSLGIKITVCADVRTRFVDAAKVFGPQKGASPSQVVLLTERLRSLSEKYHDTFGCDVHQIERSGAAGGLAGGLAAIGARLVDGFDAIASAQGLTPALEELSRIRERSDRGDETGPDRQHHAIVVTGEGQLDRTSFSGKVVGGVVTRASQVRLPVLIVCGAVEDNLPIPENVSVVSLVDSVGPDKAMTQTTTAVTTVVEHFLREFLAQ